MELGNGTFEVDDAICADDKTYDLDFSVALFDPGEA
jgi:hypothetical protein